MTKERRIIKEFMDKFKSIVWTPYGMDFVSYEIGVSDECSQEEIESILKEVEIFTQTLCKMSGFKYNKKPYFIMNQNRFFLERVICGEMAKCVPKYFEDVYGITAIRNRDKINAL